MVSLCSDGAHQRSDRLPKKRQGYSLRIDDGFVEVAGGKGNEGMSETLFIALVNFPCM